MASSDGFTRRDMLAGAAAAMMVLATPPAVARQATEMTLTIGRAAGGAAIAADFLGLSYEVAQLANPAFFSAENRALVALFRGLSPSGNLRLGGGSSAYATYAPVAPAGPPPFETFGPDTSKTAKRQVVITDVALRNLRGFLDATGWSCLYGLDLARDSKENAAAEAVAAQRFLGDRLVAVQIGNEPDSYRTRYRSAQWGPADFVGEWNEFHETIAAAAPGVRFAGPDISNKLDYLTAFAADARHHRDVIMLTGHYYAMGPAGSPDATIGQLLSAAPRQATLQPAGLPVIGQAQAVSGLPYRVSEGNSCWNGGQPGVSDTFAAALWGADTMLRFARRGWIGVNWHGGGDGIYTPIAGAPSTGFTRRPLYFGMRFAQLLTGGRFLAADAAGLPEEVGLYVVEQAGHRRLAVVNKSASNVAIRLPTTTLPGVTLLAAPSPISRTGVAVREIAYSPSRTVVVPSFSGAIYTMPGDKSAV